MGRIFRHRIHLQCKPSPVSKTTFSITEPAVLKIIRLAFIVFTHNIGTNEGYTLAITNDTNPADAASFYLPAIQLVSGARPSCSFCTKSLFSVYDQFAANTTLEISSTYTQAAEIVNLNCGPGFVNTTYSENQASWAGRRIVTPPWWGTLVLTGALGMALWVVC